MALAALNIPLLERHQAPPPCPPFGYAQEHAVALALAKDEKDRLRRALLDAEIDLQVCWLVIS